MQPSFTFQTMPSVFGTLDLNIIVSAPSASAFKIVYSSLISFLMCCLCVMLGFFYFFSICLSHVLFAFCDSVRGFLVLLVSINKQIYKQSGQRTRQIEMGIKLHLVVRRS